jgi:hypothetical protein
MLSFAAAALWLPIWIALGADPPQLKEGLWSIHSQTIDNPGNKKTESSSTICRSHAYDQHVQSIAKDRKGCTLNESFAGGAYTSEVHCVVAGAAIDTKGTSVYQGDASTHSESHTTYTPAFAGVSESTMVMDQKYIGSCPAGIQPGDRTAADGKVTHLWKQ